MFDSATPVNATVRLEAHQHAATLYFRDVLSPASVARAMMLVHGLAKDVRSLRADLRDVRLFDPDAFGQLARALATWRSEHQGAVDVRFGERGRRAPWRVAQAPTEIGAHDRWCAAVSM